MSEQQSLMVQVNLNGVFAELCHRLQRCIDMVSFGLRSTPQGSAEATTFPLSGAWFHVVTADAAMLQGEELRNAFGAWVLTCGLRDAVEVLNVFLERAGMAAAIYSLWQRFRIVGTRDARIPSEEWNTRVAREAARLHRLGLPDKLERLLRYSPTLAPSLTNEVLTVNQARNCLVHRGGVVTDRDANGPDGLVVRWEKVSLELDAPSGRKPLQLPQYVAEGGNLVMNFERTSKLFRFGETVSFTSQEFAEMCMTFVRFGTNLCHQLSDYGVATGFIAQP
jgi:hypothetical protein